MAEDQPQYVTRDQHCTEIRQEMQAFRTETRQGFDCFRHTTTQQLWVMVGTIAFAVLTGVIKLVFFSLAVAAPACPAALAGQPSH
jgi:hypothetical protein